MAKLGLSKDKLVEKRAVEVGNIFPLETKYTDALGVFYTDEEGKDQSIIMGCYGIGISRLVGLLAEHFADDKGLVWPTNIAPAQVYLARLGNSEEVAKRADDLYEILSKSKVEVLYDDRDVRAGEKFADADLMGIPYRIVVNAKTVAANAFEVKARQATETQLVSEEELLKMLGG